MHVQSRAARKPLILTSALAVSALVLSACGEDDGGAGGEGDSYSIGIAQPVAHPALDETREGFKQAFEDAGVEVEWDEQNAQGDASTETTIAGQMADAGHDLVGTIATTQSQAVATSVTDDPVIFMAVTDPEDAGLVDSWEAPGANLSGTSDLNPVDEQLELIQQADEDIETVGVLYASGESNSEVQVELAEEAAEDLDLEIETSTITNSSEVQQGVESLAGVDAIWIPTDNVVVSALEAVVQFSEQNDIPLFSADTDSVVRGAVGTYGIDYFALGQQAGEMAVRVLQDGEDPGEMPVETLEDLELYLNPEAAEEMGLELPGELLDSADVVVGEDVEAEDPAEAGEDEEE